MPEFKFTPTSATSGTWEYTYTGGVTGGGSGNYTIVDSGANKIIDFHGTASTVLPKKGTGTGGLLITLTPTDDECSG